MQNLQRNSEAPRSGGLDFLFYVALTVGMAIACTNHAVLAELHALSSGVWVAVAVGGALCCLVGLIIGELASMFPGAPGVRAYVRAAFGDVLSLTSTYLLLTLVVLFSSVESYFFVTAVARVIPGVPYDLLAVGAIVVVTLVNLTGAELPRNVQIFSTILLVALLGWLVIASLVAEPAHVELAGGAEPGLSLGVFATAVGSAVFLFTGFEWGTVLGRNPAAYRRMVPLAMPVGIVVLSLLFVGLAAGFDRHFAPMANLGYVPHIDLGLRIQGRSGEIAMVAVSVLSIVTTFNAGFMGASRLLYAVARERRFHPWAARVHLRTGVPVGAVLFIGIACAATTLVVSKAGVHEAVALVCAAIYCCIYGVLVLSAVRLRSRRPQAQRPFRSPIPVPVQVVVGASLLCLALGVIAGNGDSRVVTIALFAGSTALCLAAGFRQARRS